MLLKVCLLRGLHHLHLMLLGALCTIEHLLGHCCILLLLLLLHDLLHLLLLLGGRDHASG